MAKPAFASLFASSSSSARRHRASPSSSSSSSSSSTSPHPPLNRSSRSRPGPPRTRPRTRPRTLALLAALSATPLSAHAYPLDPPETSLPFLYPPFTLEPTNALAKRSAAPSTSDAAVPTTTGAPPSPPSQCQYDRADLPDKYILGDDGLWHKTPWSLYGSAYCNAPCSTTPPDNDTDSGGGPPQSFDDFDPSSLPTGWTSITLDDASHRGIVVVLALSVALALIIIILMFACIFWRRKQPKRDPEKLRRRSLSTADDNSFRGIQEAKAAQRKWCRAAIRWRDNIRVSAHRRRTNRALAPATSYSTLTHEEGTDGRSSLSRSRSSSPTLSERSVTPTPVDARSSSVASIHSSLSPIQTPRMLTSTDLPLPPLSPPLTQPPAYDPPSSLSESHVSPENTYLNGGSSGTSKVPISSHTQFQPYGVASLSGHVATDEKAILSLRATLASAPPVSSSSIPQPASVPSMEDEDAFEWPSGSWPSSPNLDEYSYEPHPPYSPPTSLFPPPPSKGKQRFDYFQDLDMSVSLDSATVEPQLGPSAPPFEECGAVPSAPPLDFDEHVPSAPPMESEDCPDTAVSGSEDGAASVIPTPLGT